MFMHFRAYELNLPYMEGGMYVEVSHAIFAQYGLCVIFFCLYLRQFWGPLDTYCQWVLFLVDFIADHFQSLLV